MSNVQNGFYGNKWLCSHLIQRSKKNVNADATCECTLGDWNAACWFVSFSLHKRVSFRKYGEQTLGNHSPVIAEREQEARKCTHHREVAPLTHQVRHQGEQHDTCRVTMTTYTLPSTTLYVQDAGDKQLGWQTRWPRSSDSKSQPVAPETLGSVSVSASVPGYNGADRIVRPTECNVNNYIFKSIGQIVLPAAKKKFHQFFA